MSKTKTKAINLSLLTNAERSMYNAMNPEEQAAFLGYGKGARNNFDTPNFISTKNEDVIQQGNSFIVMGLDRPGSFLSTRMETHAAAIDIVVGRKSFLGRRADDKGNELYVDPDPILDAARVYISQKSNPDGMFRLAGGTVGNTSNIAPRSTVALKADTLRLVARENIKLVTRTDSYNSQGGEILTSTAQPYGIDLIACNDDSDMQPLVKGDNLRECLTEIVGAINELRGLFNNYVDENRNLTIAMMSHTHHSPFYGVLTSPDFTSLTQTAAKTLINNITDVTAQLPMHATKCAFIEANYLGAAEVVDSVGENGKSTYILSKYNHTN